MHLPQGKLSLHLCSAVYYLKKIQTEEASSIQTVFVPVFLKVVFVLLFFCLQLDPENTGFIAVENFTSLVEHHELQLDPSKLDMLLALVQSNEEGQVCYQELIELVSGIVRDARGGGHESISCPVARRQIPPHVQTFCWISEKVT